MKIEIDVAEFAAQLKEGKGIGGKDGALQAELETPRDRNGSFEPDLSRKMEHI
ncbi:hypothetical protein JHD48_09280 [Sulfurimonas sp. SAG-AH-194-I05]|nr:hypothetical protein [Sulfurimonas sp. SAG-AH-194-I05]MDF1875925.1 hypothetical protein [Sulfurimonas sp. SAG-AH-194-I05]